MLSIRVQTLLGSFSLLFFYGILPAGGQEPGRPDSYEHLTVVFEAWRDFESPPFLDGAPDYTREGREGRWPTFLEIRGNLASIDTAGWSVAHKVDWTLVWAEMNGYEFNHKVLKPWERDPAFYKSLWLARSDVPAHEGPTHHATTELWTYTFPLTASERQRLLDDLRVIPALNRQAKQNLRGNARELWVAGIRDIRSQETQLREMTNLPGVAADPELRTAIAEATAATADLAAWLETQAPSKTGPSGLGKAAYTWYQQNVHLLPLRWEDEVMLLKRELARAWSALKLEEHRNRDLPPLEAADSPEAYSALAEASARSLLQFLDEQEIVSVKEYFAPALEEHLGHFVPEATRNFFWITAHYDPRPLYSHFYHWFELARMDLEPHASPVRRNPLLYNIFDSRNEGVATAVEEVFMQAGLYDERPRVRELVYILIAQRAARGLGSLYAHANLMTMEEAGGIHSEYTPRGWMKTEPELLRFEQHLYMRQPGYGTSYITGKYLFEQTLMETARLAEKQGETFRIGAFMDGLNRIGNIPMSLAAWQLTGSPIMHITPTPLPPE